jgi:hypothetical protein
MRLRRRGRDDRGAVALLTAMLTVVILGSAALAIDITMLSNQRQELHDTVDASAHAGAFALPSTTAAAKALAAAQANDPTVTPDIDFYCIVGSHSGVVDVTHIPGSCNPASQKSGSTYRGARCNSKICSIPCFPNLGDACNSIRVIDEKNVPYGPAQVFGLTQGSTGSVTSVACKGSCGTATPNPMDVAVVADRTGSMSTGGLSGLITGIKGMLQVMTPSMHYVSLGTIGRSNTTTRATTSCNSTNKGLSWPSSSDTAGQWVPLSFYNDYLVTNTTTLNTSSNLVKAIDCLSNKSSTGTELAAPLKFAARYLLGGSYEANNVAALGGAARPGVVTKAIIFETDGEPNEDNLGTDTSLATSTDLGSSNGTTACNNLKSVAANAKAQNILVVTVAYDVSSVRCNGGSTEKVIDVLAQVASAKSPGVPSSANYDCSTTSGQASENSDGDYLFCAADGTDMAGLFRTAFGQLASGVRFIKLP